jgi:hypothetical protein
MTSHLSSFWRLVRLARELERDRRPARLVVIESPYGRNPDGSVASPETIERNVRYLRACMADSLRRGEAPIASHAMYTQPGVLDDSQPEERRKGMLAGWAWHERADAVVVYRDLGVTPPSVLRVASIPTLRACPTPSSIPGEWAGQWSGSG